MIDDVTRAALLETRGLIEVVDAEALAALAAEVPPDMMIVEIGSHTGLSTCWMAAAAAAGRGAHVVAVDPYLDPRPRAPGVDDDPFDLKTGAAVLAEFDANRVRLGLLHRIQLARTTSLLAAASGWVRPVGLIFIDAMHDFASVRADYEAWLPHLYPGSWLAFHDIFEDPERTIRSDTYRVIDEIVMPSGMWTEPTEGFNLWTARRR